VVAVVTMVVAMAEESTEVIMTDVVAVEETDVSSETVEEGTIAGEETAVAISTEEAVGVVDVTGVIAIVETGVIMRMAQMAVTDCGLNPPFLDGTLTMPERHLHLQPTTIQLITIVMTPVRGKTM